MDAARNTGARADALPTLTRHEGVWEGHYRHYDAEGRLRDEHASTLICRFPSRGPWPYFQTNLYRWADGRTERRDFPATIEDGRLIWHGGLIEGWAADVPLDAFGRTTMLYWVRSGEADAYLYEMIQISDCGGFRNRVWQGFRDGRLVRRTLIDERRTGTDWSAWPV